MGAYIGQTVLLVASDETSPDEVGHISGQSGDRFEVTTLAGRRVGNVRWGGSRDEVIDDAEDDRATVNKYRGIDAKVHDLTLFAHAPACYPAGEDTSGPADEDDDAGDDEDQAPPQPVKAARPASKRSPAATRPAGKRKG
jgi:hypothetical protein